mgnify:CR=1 FL=1
MADLVWRGSVEIFEQPGSPRITSTPQGDRTVRVYRGPFAALKSARPTPGQTMAGFDGKVDSVDVVPDGAGPNGPGTMTITIATDEVVYEIDTTMLEKPLAKHPLFAAGGDKALTSDDSDKIEGWKNAAISSERRTMVSASCSESASARAAASA